MFLDVATQQQSAALFIAANSRHYWAQVVGQNLTVGYKGFWSCDQQKLLQLWRRPQRSSVQYSHLAGSALRYWAFECDLN
jgi:hypothetical protein